MIEFENKLPSLNIEGRKNGTYNNEEAGYPCVFTTDDHRLGDMIDSLRKSVFDDRRLVFIDGKVLMCSKNWIRDHVHEMKAFCHWEYDLKSFIDFIIDTQKGNGCYYELIKQLDDYHWKYVHEDNRVIYHEDNLALVRLECEADIEYIVVEGVRDVYRATGDEEWVKKVLPKIEKGIEYITHDSLRWDEEHGLAKRPLTIDTWDFEYRHPGNDRKIDENTPWCIMHGDNSGLYAAMNTLAYFRRLFHDEAKAKSWEERAEKVKENMFKYLWNGKFFIHQLYLGHSGADDKENIRLSLSNTYDMNRGVTDVEQSGSIINEYMERRKTTKAFAEWFSIDPPYEPWFEMTETEHHAAGRYVNGAISPFTAGELAKAAFNNGYEEYGWDIISRFIQMMERDGDIYFLYSPIDGNPQGGGPSAWGAAALLSAIDEGLAGIVDVDCLYSRIYFSPKFPVTGYTELRYITGYEISHQTVDVRWISKDEGMRYDIISPAIELNCHIMIPKGRDASRVIVDGREFRFEKKKVAGTDYVDFDIEYGGKHSIEIIYG